MGRGSDTANTAATTAQTNSNQFMGNSNALYSTLAPTLSAEAAHPAGYSPTDTANMNTAAQQSAGGAEAGAVGQGSLAAARTRNAGAFAPAISEGVRNAGRNLSTAAIGIQGKNADLKQKQMQEGIGGLEGLYGTSVGGANAALGQVAPNVNANTNAVNSSWDWASDLFNPMLQAAGGGAGAYYGAKR